MNLFKLSTSIFILFFITKLTSAQQFKIEGKSEGFADGTWLYMNMGKSVDSTEVKNGRFSFNGLLKEPAIRVVIHSKNHEDYAFFWIEPKQMTISLKKGEFRNAKMNGSETQNQNQLLINAIHVIEDKEKALETAYKSTNDQAKQKEIYQQAMDLEKEQKEAYITFIQQNPNSIVAADQLMGAAAEIGREKVIQLYDHLSNNLKTSYYGEQIRKFIYLNKEIKIGSQFVDFEQLNTKGKNVKLSEVRSKYTLLEFWGSWCIPCRKGNPELIKTYETFKDKGFSILGVAADGDRNAWLKAVKEDQLPWENVCDLKGDKNMAVVMYGIYSFPSNFLIDEKGIIVAKDLTGDDLVKKLKEVLQ